MADEQYLVHISTSLYCKDVTTLHFVI